MTGKFAFGILTKINLLIKKLKTVKYVILDLVKMVL